ncbi:signal peptidase II [Nocardioides sp.]|uniref:signal peptidase II n=1 Tax=Nocardioides sp. TaxID=35761 RepID=UPI00271AF89E|nr:signal peptidase II [Nocardioides sp.]MDO9458343.1 signal peptidase II [Nocardioides sp.]
MQAARGTPVGPSLRRRLLFAAIALAAYAVDQVSKLLAVERLEGQPDVHVIGDVLQLHLTYNPGAAFSTGTGLTPLITAVAIGATLAVLWYSRRIGSATWAVALGLLLAGITGNLTDRLLRDPSPLRGHVVDFLQLPNWPIFNVADICINVAAALIVIQALRGIRLDGTRADADTAAEVAGAEADRTDADPTDADRADRTDDVLRERSE